MARALPRRRHAQAARAADDRGLLPASTVTAMDAGNLEDVEQKVTLHVKARAPQFGRQQEGTLDVPMGRSLVVPIHHLLFELCAEGLQLRLQKSDVAAHHAEMGNLLSLNPKIHGLDADTQVHSGFDPTDSKICGCIPDSKAKAPAVLDANLN